MQSEVSIYQDRSAPDSCGQLNENKTCAAECKEWQSSSDMAFHLHHTKARNLSLPKTLTLFSYCLESTAVSLTEIRFWP